MHVLDYYNTYNTGSIHGVDSTSDGKSYIYDDVGNQFYSDGRTLDYTAFNKVSRISNGSDAVEYLYGTNNEKILKSEQQGGETNLTWYVGGVEVIIEGWSNGVPERTKTKRYIGNALVTHHAAYNIDINYMHGDHLGSIQAITQQNHHIHSVYHLSYDAFGKRRDTFDPENKLLFQNPVNNITNKGFTGQDHIDQMGLINFNARLYDANLGMMLQADTVIPDGPAVDSINRYAYVYNNPLSYTDPTGHIPLGKGMGRGFNIWYNLMQMRTPIDATDASDFGMPDKDRTPEGVSNGAFGNGDVTNPGLSFGYTGEKASGGGNYKDMDVWVDWDTISTLKGKNDNSNDGNLKVAKSLYRNMSPNERAVYESTKKNLQLQKRAAEDDYYDDSWRNREIGSALISGHYHGLDYIEPYNSNPTPLTVEDGRIEANTEGSWLPKRHNGITEAYPVNNSFFEHNQYPLFGVMVITPTIHNRVPVNNYRERMENLATRASALVFLIHRGKVYGFNQKD